MTAAPKTFAKRDVVRLICEMAERHGGQGVLATALGLNAMTVSRAASGVSLRVAMTDALGLRFDDAKGRYVQFSEPRYVTGVDPVAALTSELADTRLSLKAATMKISALQDEVDRLKSKLAGNDRVAA